MLRTTVVGNYPKISSDEKALNLRSYLNRYDKKKITEEELDWAYNQTIKRVISEQEEAGVDIITDGHIRWDDLVTPFAKNIDGFEIEGLIRFFDNNVYYRRPIIKSKLTFKDYSTVSEFKFATKHSKNKVKQVIVGPFTFAHLSKDEYYKNIEKLTLDLAEILKKEAEGLQEAGCDFIQIDEPWLCFDPDRLDLVYEGVKIITQDLKSKTALYLYFGSIKRLVPKLFDFPVDVVGVDIISKTENLNLILENSFKKEIALGCLDARNTKLEPEDELLDLFEKVTGKLSSDKIYVNPSCGLEFLPHGNALMKLKRMVEAVKIFNRMGE